MTYNDGDKVEIIDGSLCGIVGKIIKTDSIEGTESITYAAPWLGGGGIAYNIPLDHLRPVAG